MLKIKNKNYDIEETIQLTDNEDNLLYEFKMQITIDELAEIKELIFNSADEIRKEYMNTSLSERYEIEEKAELKAKENVERFTDICFKEHKERFLELAGKNRMNEMVDMLMGFFIQHFVDKQLKVYDTSITSLKNRIPNYPKFK